MKHKRNFLYFRPDRYGSIFNTAHLFLMICYAETLYVLVRVFFVCVCVGYEMLFPSSHCLVICAAIQK